ncbi:MAG: thioesterase family protein [Polyangiaceae bacterium]
MQNLDAVLTPRTLGDGRYAFCVPEGWGQGKAVFGGLVLGGLVRAMTRELSDDARPLRSLSAELVGSPVPGDARIDVRVLRAGKAVTTLCADLSQNGELLTHAVAVFGADRSLALPRLDLERPRMPPWKDTPLADMSAAFAPQFTQHFEYRPVHGYPFSGQKASTSGWLRPRLDVTENDAAFVTALADAWWIGEMVAFSEPRAAATLTFGIDLHEPLTGLPRDAPLFHQGEGLARTGGYASEVRTLWGEDGRLVSVNRQLIAIIK